MNEEEFNERNDHIVNSQSFVKAQKKFIDNNQNTFAQNVKEASRAKDLETDY